MRIAGCTHKFIVDGKNVGTCALCGEVRQFPWEKGGQVVVLKEGSPTGRRSKNEKAHVKLNIHKRNVFYETNKAAIAADMISIGRSATQRKWGIPKGTYTKLEERWLTPGQRERLSLEGSQQSLPSLSSQTEGNGRLPAFPPFSSSWDPSVQHKWFEVYEKLSTEVHSKE